MGSLTIEDLKRDIAQIKYWDERTDRDSKPELRALRKQMISERELEIARRRRIAEYFVPLPRETDNGKQKRKLPDDEHYRQEANQLLDAHSSNKGEVLQDLVRERGFDREWLRLHKILHRLQNLKKSLKDAMENTDDEMKVWEEEILEDLQLTGIDFRKEWFKVCRRYREKYGEDLRLQYFQTFYTLSSIIYDKFFVPFCAMLFKHLEELIAGKFIDDSEACRMLQFCMRGLSENGHNIKIDFKFLERNPESFDPETVQQLVYLGNSNKFTRSRQKEVLEWAKTLWQQVERRRQLQRQFK